MYEIEPLYIQILVRGIILEEGIFMPSIACFRLHYTSWAVSKREESACSVSNWSIIPAEIENLLPGNILLVLSDALVGIGKCYKSPNDTLLTLALGVNQ